MTADSMQWRPPGVDLTMQCINNMGFTESVKRSPTKVEWQGATSKQVAVI